MNDDDAQRREDEECRAACHLATQTGQQFEQATGRRVDAVVVLIAYRSGGVSTSTLGHSDAHELIVEGLLDTYSATTPSIVEQDDDAPLE